MVRSRRMNWLFSIGDNVECNQASYSGEKSILFLKAYSSPKQTRASYVSVMMKVVWMDPYGSPTWQVEVLSGLCSPELIGQG